MPTELRIAEIGPGVIKIPPVGFGAVERVIWELYQALGKRGHSVIINNTPPGGLKSIVDGNYLPHCHWSSHARWLTERGVKYAYTSHSHIWRQTCYDAIMNSTVYLALHEGMVPDEYQGTVVIVGNGVNPEFWSNTSLNRDPIVVSCANYSERKRLEWMWPLIDSLDQEWRGIVVGPDVPKHLGRNTNDRIEVRGEMVATELRDLYNKCMVGFHPAREEAFALVPLEMASCGLFTYVSKDSHVYGLGFIDSFSDVESAAAMINSLKPLENPHLWSMHRSTSDYVAETHSWDKVAQRVIKGMEVLANG